MAGIGVAILSRGGPEVADDEFANRCRKGGCVPALVDPGAELIMTPKVKSGQSINIGQKHEILIRFNR